MTNRAWWVVQVVVRAGARGAHKVCRWAHLKKMTLLSVRSIPSHSHCSGIISHSPGQTASRAQREMGQLIVAPRQTVADQVRRSVVLVLEEPVALAVLWGGTGQVGLWPRARLLRRVERDQSRQIGLGAFVAVRRPHRAVVRGGQQAALFRRESGPYCRVNSVLTRSLNLTYGRPSPG